ncbi:kelch-like protein 14 isoform X1 [Branchiostoma floridae x Branchiostoma japonicum]
MGRNTCADTLRYGQVMQADSADTTTGIIAQQWKRMRRDLGDSANHMLISDPAHAQKVLEGFHALRADKVLCDFVIVAEKQSFAVHKAVLASSSDYFKALFAGLSKDCKLDKIELQGVTAAGLFAVVEYLYTSNLTLSLGNVEEVLVAANILVIPSVIKLCSEYLNQQIASNTCMEVASIAAMFNLRETKDLATKCFIQQFQDLSLEEILDVLESDQEFAFPEMTLFRVGLMWLNRDRENRMQHAATLMTKIRFPLIPASDLVEHVQTVDFMKNEPVCQKLLLDAMNYHLMPLRQVVLQSATTRLRCRKQAILAVGGIPKAGDQSVNNPLHFYNEEKRAWVPLTVMPYKTGHQCVAVINNFLFVAGGEDRWDPEGKYSVNSVSRYDPRFNTWLQVAPMNERRSCFYMGSVDGHLYSIGGRNADGYVASVECYSPDKNEWKHVTNMEKPCAAHAGTVCDGKIFISGGAVYGDFVNTMSTYDPTENQWDNKAVMGTKRAHHTMATVRDKIYVIGGNHTKGNQCIDVLIVESYCPEDNTWSTVAPIMEGRTGPGIAVLDRKVFVVGGYSWNDGQYQTTVQCYNTEDDKWDYEGELPEALAGVSCMTLDLPHHLAAF